MTSRDIGTILIVVSAVGELAFCLFYCLFARWWKTLAGRQLFAKSAVLGLVLTLWAIGAITDASRERWFELLRLVLFALVPLVVWGKVALLVRVNWRAWQQSRRAG